MAFPTLGDAVKEKKDDRAMAGFTQVGAQSRGAHRFDDSGGPPRGGGGGGGGGNRYIPPSQRGNRFAGLDN
jgi:hypothetical protein